MGEVEPQDAEERHPALGVALELLIPVILAGEPAVHHADDAGAAGAGLDDPLRRHRSGSVCGSAACVCGFGDEAAGRVPELDPGDGLHARAEVRGGVAIDALLDRAGDEPGRDPRAGRDGAPDLLRRPGDLHLGLDGPAAVRLFLDRHHCSLVRGVCGTGWAMSTRRCARPPGLDSSWYFETSWVMAAVSSAVNAARSAADRNRTSVSTASVARALPASLARRERSLTSRTTRAPRAIR